MFVLTFLFIILSFFEVYQNYITCVDWNYETITDKIIILSGIPYLWVTYDFFSKWIWKFKYYRIYGFSFLIYALHASLLVNGAKKIFISILGTSELGLFMSYILTFFTTSLICVFIIDIINKHFPKLYAFAAGGRAPRK